MGFIPRDPTPSTDTDVLNARTTGDSANATYKTASLVLYRALSGDRNLDRAVNSSDQQFDIDGSSLPSPMAQLPATYFAFQAKHAQLQPDQAQSVHVRPRAIRKFSTATRLRISMNPRSTGYNPTFDLWSTGGQRRIHLQILRIPYAAMDQKLVGRQLPLTPISATLIERRYKEIIRRSYARRSRLADSRAARRLIRYGETRNFACPESARHDLRRIDSHRLHQILLHAVGAALAQIEIVFGRAERISVALDRECRVRIAFDQRAQLLQLRRSRSLANPRCRIRKADRPACEACRAGTERAFLREQLNPDR